MAVFDLGVCADESGIHDGSSLCLLSGYMASVNRWMEFDRRWLAVLEQHGVADFHSKDFFAFDKGGKRVGKYRLWSDQTQKGFYGDWSDKKAEDFIGGLLGAIHNSSVNPIGAYVPTDAFWSMTYGERKFLTGGKFAGQKWITSGAPSKPYFLVFDHCLAEAGQRTKPGLKTLFVFDQQKQFESRAIQQFGESMFVLNRDPNKLGDRFAGVLFQDRIEVPGLQAADLYTHCWYRHVSDPDRGGMRYDALEVLTEKVPGMKFYTLEHMKGLFRHLPPEVHDAIRNWPQSND